MNQMVFMGIQFKNYCIFNSFNWICARIEPFWGNDRWTFEENQTEMSMYIWFMSVKTVIRDFRVSLYRTRTTKPELASSKTVTVYSYLRTDVSKTAVCLPSSQSIQRHDISQHSHYAKTNQNQITIENVNSSTKFDVSKARKKNREKINWIYFTLLHVER